MTKKIFVSALLISLLFGTAVCAIDLYEGFDYDFAYGLTDYIDDEELQKIYKRGVDDTLDYVENTVDEYVWELEHEVEELKNENTSLNNKVSELKTSESFTHLLIALLIFGTFYCLKQILCR